MKETFRILLLLSVILVYLWFFKGKIWAQKRDEEIKSTRLEVLKEKQASPSSQSTPSAEKSQTPSVVERVVEKKDDITEPTPETKGKLERYLAEHPIGPLTPFNFLQHGIRAAVRRGVPANTIVLLLLFSLVASLIAASRHLIGLRGFGIFIPAVLSVAFVATGIFVGILVFLIILSVATFGRVVLKKLKIQYLPRMALLLWFVSLGVLLTIFIAPFVNIKSLIVISIFPILILILLAENFIEVQIGKSMEEAVSLTAETLILALFCSLIVNLDFLQKGVLLYPEATVVLVALFDIFMGKYVGLRLLEYRKFREILK